MNPIPQEDAAWRDCVYACVSAGLELDPNNVQMKEALEEVMHAEAGGQGGMPGGMDSMFGPQFIGRLQMDPRTRPYLQQQDFLAMMQNLQKNPGAMQTYFADPRFKMAMQVSDPTCL